MTKIPNAAWALVLPLGLVAGCTSTEPEDNPAPPAIEEAASTADDVGEAAPEEVIEEIAGAEAPEAVPVALPEVRYYLIADT